MVSHPSTNRAQHRLTSLIKTNDATTMPCRHRLKTMKIITKSNEYDKCQTLLIDSYKQTRMQTHIHTGISA